MTRPPRVTRSAILGVGVLLAMAMRGTAHAGPTVPTTPDSKAAPTPDPSASPPSHEMRAEMLFRSGEKKFDAGQYTEACSDFAESLKHGPKLGTLLNLALCHETVGKIATAWREFTYAAAWAAQNGQKDRREFAMQHVAALETRLPRVLLQLPAERAIASVEVDGEPLAEARWYVPLYLDAGEHAVAISAPGKQRGTVTFRVTSAPTPQIVVIPSLADEGKTSPGPATPAPKAASSTPRLVGFVLVGVGAAGIVTSGIFGGLAIGQRDDASAHCRGNVCDAVGADRYRSAQSMATVSTVAFVVGAAAAVAGGYLLWKNPSQNVAVGVSPRTAGAELGLEASF